METAHELRLKKSRWFYFTLLLGLVPYVVRLFSGLLRMATDNLPSYPASYLLAPGDIVAFALVLNITIINESLDLAHIHPRIRTRNTGLAIAFIFLLAGIYMGSLIIEGKTTAIAMYVSKVLFFVAVVLSVLSGYIGQGMYNIEKIKPIQNPPA
jgi:hypothetical protein